MLILFLLIILSIISYHNNSYIFYHFHNGTNRFYSTYATAPYFFLLKDVSHINIVLLNIYEHKSYYKIINNTLNYITVNLI